MEFTYSQKQTKKGLVKYRHWKEEFKDESRPNEKGIIIDRSEPIELNGEPLVWYSNSEISKMSKEERDRLLI